MSVGQSPVVVKRHHTNMYKYIIIVYIFKNTATVQAYNMYIAQMYYRNTAVKIRFYLYFGYKSLQTKHYYF